MPALDQRNEIVRVLSNTLGIKSSYGVTGSTANGIPTTRSDIDLFIIIAKENINEITTRIYGLKTFQLPSNKVLSYFKEGKIEVIFLYGEINNIPINLEIYSLYAVKRLLDLEPSTLRRFRTRPTAEKAIFYDAIGNSISVVIDTKPFAEGFISSLPGYVKQTNLIYIGNHLDKLLSGRLYSDVHEIELEIKNCFNTLIKNALKNKAFSDNCLLNLFSNKEKFIESVKEQYRALAQKLVRTL